MRKPPATVVAKNRALVLSLAASSMGRYSTGAPPMIRFVLSVSVRSGQTSRGEDARSTEPVATTARGISRLKVSRQACYEVLVATPQPGHTKDSGPKAYLLDEAKAAAQRAEAVKAGDRPKRRRSLFARLGLWLGGFVLLLVGGGVVTAFLLPGCIKERAIREAAEHGVALTIDDVSLGMTQLTFKGVRATSSNLPGFTMTAGEADVALSGFSPESITVRSPEVTLEGPADVLGATVAKLNGASGEKRGARPKLPKIVIDQGHVVWSKLAAGTSLEAMAVHAEITDGGGDPQVQGVAPRINLTTPKGRIGDWRCSYEGGGDVSRVRIAFDPEVPESPNAIFVVEKGTVTEADLELPRSPWKRLRIPAALFGLPEENNLQVEAKVNFARALGSAVDLHARLGLYGMRFPAMKQVPLDAVLEAEAKGKTNDTLAIQKGELSVGRLRGAITGTLKVADSIRLDAAWKPPPIECQAFATPPPPAPGTDPAQAMMHNLESFVQSLGKVTGTIQLGAHLVFDTSDLAHAKVDPDLRANCSWSLFGP